MKNMVKEQRDVAYASTVQWTFIIIHMSMNMPVSNMAQAATSQIGKQSQTRYFGRFITDNCKKISRFVLINKVVELLHSI